MNNDTPSQYGSPELQAMIVERATPAATTSGAAGTIDEFLYAPGGMMPAQPGRGGWYRTQDVVAAVAAARESALLEKQHTVDKLQQECIKLSNELARLRAAPVVGEAVAVVRGSDTVIGRESRSLAWAKDFSPFTLEIGTKLYTAPHAAKEAGKVDELALSEVKWRIENILERGLSALNEKEAHEAIAIIDHAALARTTNNKENDRG